MSFFGKLVKGAIDTVLLPVDVVKDLTFQSDIDVGKSDTCKRLNKIVNDIEEAGEDAGEGRWIR